MRLSRRCTGELVSRNGNTFRAFAELATWIAEQLKVESAVLDGEIACPDESGQPTFRDEIFRKRQCIFIAFDLLSVWLCGSDASHEGFHHASASTIVALASLFS